MASQDLEQWLTNTGAPSTLVTTLVAISKAGTDIAGLLRAGSASRSAVQTIINIQGEAQKPMDRLADDCFINRLRECGTVSVLVSEEQDEAVVLSAGPGIGVSFDPLDGSSNLEINGPVGSIFSLVKVAAGADANGMLIAGGQQVAAGYILYGAATIMVVAIGGDVSGFTMDDRTFRCTHPDLRVPASNREYAINSARERYWEHQTRAYVRACLDGADGPFKAKYNTRWNAAFVAEVHRIILRGGIFLYPVDKQNSANGGRLRLLYEVNPMAYVLRAAGGAATDGEVSILDKAPVSIHQRSGIVLGSADEVARFVEQQTISDCT